MTIHIYSWHSALLKASLFLISFLAAAGSSGAQSFAPTATFILKPDLIIANKGDTVIISVYLNGDNIPGTDLITYYDPAVLAGTGPVVCNLLPGLSISCKYDLNKDISSFSLRSGPGCTRYPDGNKLFDLRFLFCGGSTKIRLASPGQSTGNPEKEANTINCETARITDLSFLSLSGLQDVILDKQFQQRTSASYFSPAGEVPAWLTLAGSDEKVAVKGSFTNSPGTGYYHKIESPRSFYKIMKYGERRDPASTLCDAFTIPFGPETFNSPGFPPTCWSKYSGLLSESTTLTSTSDGWADDNWMKNPGPVNPSARIEISGTDCNFWLMTPQIDLGQASSYFTLEFDLGLAWWDPNAPPPAPECQGVSGIDDKFAVVISTDGGATWSSSNTLRVWDNTGSPYIYDSIDPHGEHITLNLEGYSGVVMIGFYGESTIANVKNDLMIDNVSIQPATNNRTLDLKLYLEGLYAGNGIMYPANDAAGPHFGPETADQISVELHQATSPYNTVYSFNNVNLSIAGEATIGAIPPGATGDYYIVIKHRNSIETWSSVPLSFTGPANLSYDYSTDASTAYGNNMKQAGEVYLILAGDANQDGIDDGADMSLIFNASLPPVLSGYYPQDINGDGIVDGADLSLLFNNSKPPPAQVQRP